MSEDPQRGLYVYGVVAAAGYPPLPAVPGVGGEPLELVTHGDLAAVVSPVSLGLRRGRRAELLSHSDVLNAIAVERDVVPAQFGTVMHDEGEVVRDLLHDQEPGLLHLLDRLSGAVQLNLRATYVQDQVLGEIVRANPRVAALRERTRDLPPGVPHPDAVQLGRLVSDEMEVARAVDRDALLRTITPLAREVRVRDRTDIDTVVDVALLVDRDAVAGVEDSLEGIAAEVHPRIRMSLTGPLAPFDFVREESWV
jgi:hypothetical protein